MSEAQKLLIWRLSMAVLMAAGIWSVRDAGWDVVWRSGPFLLRGIGATLLLTVISVSIGLAGGVVLAILRLFAPPGLRHLAIGYIEVLRAIPQLMVIFWVFYTWPAITGSSVPGWWAAVISLSMIAAAYLAEVVRAGILSVPKTQWESGYVTGLSALQNMTRIILPQAGRNMLPALISHFIMMLKTTSLVYVVGIIDFFRAIIIVNNRDFAPAALYLTMAAGYFVGCYALSWLVRRIEPRYALTT
ncbi:MAG: polar amino acid transporter inner rane subunit [Rubritepida sp.]|nr:polar amino acid transporter inner rane subunit [Rubritepida sp.]